MKIGSISMWGRTSWVRTAVCIILLGVAVTWASPGQSETSRGQTTQAQTVYDSQEVDESALDALAWAGWVGWALLMALVSLQYGRQRRLARDLGRLERSITELEKLAEGASKERES